MFLIWNSILTWHSLFYMATPLLGFHTFTAVDRFQLGFLSVAPKVSMAQKSLKDGRLGASQQMAEQLGSSLYFIPSEFSMTCFLNLNFLIFFRWELCTTCHRLALPALELSFPFILSSWLMNFFNELPQLLFKEQTIKKKNIK